MRSVRTLFLLLVIGVLSCDSPVGPRDEDDLPIGARDEDDSPAGARDEDELQFMRFPEDLAPLAETSGSVWAVKGQDRRLSLRYRTSSGPGSDEFLRFEIPGDALLQRPDGALFQPGDSVLITVQRGTDRRLLFYFEPSGLQFNPAQPARLRIEYRRLNGDLNGDGSVNFTDTRLEWRSRIWRQEQPEESWFPIGTNKDEDADEVRATITSFTGFVIAA